MTKPKSPKPPTEIVNRRTVYEGRRIDLEVLTLRSADGQESKREAVRHPGAAVVLALTADGRVIFERNYRAVLADFLLELPAGTLDEGESPADCAARELTEETGYTAARIEPLTDFYTSPGVLDERIWAFVATGLSPGQTNLDAGEQIEVELVDYGEAVAMCLDGRCRDAKSIATLLTYESQRRRGMGAKESR
jgi:ADP-ribose pyrophosphatase